LAFIVCNVTIKRIIDKSNVIVALVSFLHLSNGRSLSSSAFNLHDFAMHRVLLSVCILNLDLFSLEDVRDESFFFEVKSTKDLSHYLRASLR